MSYNYFSPLSPVGYKRNMKNGNYMPHYIKSWCFLALTTRQEEKTPWVMRVSTVRLISLALCILMNIPTCSWKPLPNLTTTRNKNGPNSCLG